MTKTGVTMKLLIAGSRSITDFELAPYIPSDTDTIISGGAAGVDGVAERYADEHGLEKMIVRPQYDRYGRAAPIKRNEQMVDMADEVLVIWDGKSKGSMHTIRYAEKVRKPLRVVCVEEKNAPTGE
jgi:predicted Rossmann fold nucleotide-binding protein DprA/Smf involved in DNA uptake